MKAEDYIKVNKSLWNEKTQYHVDSSFYDNASFLKGNTSLNDIELGLLPADLSGKKILHLQCHFGQDSISLARMGAQVTAVDFSEQAIHEANKLAEKCGESVRFICADTLALPEVLNDSFDYVFTSYGVIGWLPDVFRWATVIERYLAPHGELIFVEFHPFVWTFDDDFKYLKYDYFNTEAIIEEEEGTYADRGAGIKSSSITWNHPISDVLSSLLETGLTIKHFSEYNFSPYPCFKNAVKIDHGKYQIEGVEGKLPLVYALKAKK